MYKSPPRRIAGWLSAEVIEALEMLILEVSTLCTFAIITVQSKSELGVMVRVLVSLEFTEEYITNHPLA
jgi:hypothetical protein